MSEINNERLILRSAHAMTLGSECKLIFIKKQGGTIIPALMLIGVQAAGNHANRVWSKQAYGQVGILVSEIVNGQERTYIDTHFKDDQHIPITYLSDETTQQNQNTDWVTIDPENDKIVYPRIFINSLNIKVDSSSLAIKYQDYQGQSINGVLYKTLQPYKDYSILTRSLNQQYVLTLDNDVVITKGVLGSRYGNVQKRKIMMNYSISNADTSIYLDGLQVSKENAEPKVSYEVKPNVFNSQYCSTIYNKLGNIVRINDNDLKFKNIRGYISGISLDLDNPDNDSIEIKNYKTKFEDLFSTITAQTEQMKKNGHLLQAAASAFTSSGEIEQDVLQSSISKVNLQYAFNNGRLTIDEKNGIWGTSDNGVVAFRGGGIFTATEKNVNGDWKWNTGITPEGINANLITSGQLDTNLIKIYAGDHLRFQMNGDGIFAYKTWINDAQQVYDGAEQTTTATHPKLTTEQRQKIKDLQQKKNNGTITESQQENLDELLEKSTLIASDSIDGKQYVIYNQDGLALIAKKGAMVLNSAKNDYITVLDEQFVQKHPKLLSVQQIKRVQVSWDGFILRNWVNQRVFYADPQTGNLFLKGRIEADQGHIGTWIFNNDTIWSPAGIDLITKKYTQFVALNAGGSEHDEFFDQNGKLIENYDENGVPSTQCRDDNGNLIDNVDADGKITTIKQVNTKNFAFWAGSVDPREAPFFIKKNGQIYASSGQIGGWHLTSTELHSPFVYLSTTTKEAQLQKTTTTYQRITIPQTGEVVDYKVSTTTQQYTADFYMWAFNDYNNTDNDPAYCDFGIQRQGVVIANDFEIIDTRDSDYRIHNTTSVKQLLKQLTASVARAVSDAASARAAVQA